MPAPRSWPRLNGKNRVRFPARCVVIATDDGSTAKCTIPSRDSLIENDRRRAHPRYSEENIAKNTPLVDALAPIASDIGATPAQVAIAWLLSRGEDIVPIPGTKKIRWLEENVAATELALSDATLARRDQVFRPGITAGDRYPPGAMKQLMR